MNSRRHFISLLGGAAAAWPVAARGQQGGRVRRVGVLTGRANDAESLAWIRIFRQRLEELGWTDGRNLRIELLAVGNTDAWAAQATALVTSAPDIIVVAGNPGVTALKQETRTIPIVFVQVGDPVGSGFVLSLARPGGNITGFMHYEPAMGGKWLEALKEIAPSVTRVLVLFLPSVTANVQFVDAAKAAGSTLQMAIDSAGIRSANDIERAVTAFAHEPGGGLIVLPNPISGNNHALVAELAIRHRLPAIAAFRYMAESGILSSYGIDVGSLYRRAAEYVDRILKGEKPADLPVQAPTRYELVINLKAAKAIGLEVPPTLLVRADEVIE